MLHRLVELRNSEAKNKAFALITSERATSIISDIMEPTRHMANGEMYESKAKFRQATKDAGCVEVGTETKTLLKPRAPITLDRGQRRDAIRKTIYDLRNR